jgi:hypothetical protein
MQSSIPKKKWEIAIQIPPHRIQIIFAKVCKHPPDELLYTTFLPKGHNMNSASLKHCSPNGIPIMVQHSTTPPTK